MKAQELKIEGMTCNHCVMAVRKELAKVPNVVVEDVKIGAARVQFDERNVTMQQLEDAVAEAGYKVVR